MIRTQVSSVSEIECPSLRPPRLRRLVRCWRYRHASVSVQPTRWQITLVNQKTDKIWKTFLRDRKDMFTYRTKWALAFVCFRFFFSYFLATCARLSWSHSAFESTLNSSIVSYHMPVHIHSWLSYLSSLSVLLPFPLPFHVLLPIFPFFHSFLSGVICTDVKYIWSLKCT